MRKRFLPNPLTTYDWQLTTFPRLLVVVLCLLVRGNAAAQTGVDSTGNDGTGLAFGAFVDVYYVYDFSAPEDHERVPFLYSHSRHDEIAVNNAVLSAAYTTGRVRANVALHTGTYVQRNYAAERLNGSDLLGMIYQANVGVRLGKGLWLDAGIMPSHIGFESALSIDNPTLTRSLMAENTPYYEAGAKLGWEVNDKLTVTGLVLNGWQRIVETDANKAVGTQVQYKPAKGVLLNWSTFAGREGGNRYFSNLYGTFDLTGAVRLVAAFDVGWQQVTGPAGNKTYHHWFNPNLLARYQPVEKLALAGRLEYYHDPRNLIIPATELGDNALVTGFQTWSPSVNLDYFPAKKVALRLEGRLFRCRQPVFIRHDDPNGPATTRSNGAVATSVAFKF
jgi:hypothetical protein